MRHRGVAPVEEAVPVVGDEDVRVVQVVVLQGGRQTAVGERPAQLAVPTQVGGDAGADSGVDPVGVADEQALLVGQQIRDERRQAVRAGVGHAHREHLVGVRDQVPLQPCVAAEHRLPRLGERRPADLAQRGAAVGQEHQPPDGVHGDRREDVLGCPLPQRRHQRRLERGSAAHRLEPHGAPAHRQPERRRPRPDVRLLGRTVEVADPSRAPSRGRRPATPGPARWRSRSGHGSAPSSAFRRR